jgi:hypothetical protein
MKTTLSVMAILVFSAIMLTPKIPTEYPPKQVVEQRADIVLKEHTLDNLIDKIEYTIAVDSLALKSNENNVKQD